jgi:hypothetical protein
MLKFIAVVYGVIFLLIGLFGFIPGITTRHNLFGIFHVNGWLNVMHLLTGIIGFWVGLTSSRASQMYFQVFGVIYAAVAILGFFYGRMHILGFLASNAADSWLHLIIGILSLYLGFSAKVRKT